MRYFRSSLSVFFLINIYCEPIFCWLWFPTNSAYGIFAAIAVPLELPHRNVFVSYNFEANYNLPYTWDLPPYATNVEEEDLEARNIKVEDCNNCTQSENDSSTSAPSTIPETNKNNTENADKREIRSLITRKHFYHILKDKFEMHGYNGEACLLRLICETNASHLGQINGVLGSLIHIIFTPTTSMSEQLPLSYYQAEVDGTYEQCDYYEDACKDNLLDLISSPLIQIMNKIIMLSSALKVVKFAMDSSIVRREHLTAINSFCLRLSFTKIQHT
ncbi:uncharacterized protein LOC119674621 [Teleopsis dalmanni]|uniref:uncharacterized protein LOC119674621 n=1 Tax=Teleopsis dalmanni TaxID=139649 RepID=UPI0018CFE097|nr:uncharacterized protein LOC119674621 [Teleopsis dalmanni]